MEKFSWLSVLSLLGSLAMFLYGMEIMGDGLKNTSQSALKRILGKITSNPISGFLLGVVITALIQSSTATIVLAAGLIGAGVLTLQQSISIMIGANVGTTITGQLIRLLDVNSSSSGIAAIFQPSTLACFALVIGIVLVMFIKKGNSKSIGMIAMGFGILFMGLLGMTDAMEPLSDSERFKSLVAELSTTPIWGLLLGIVLTMIVQSSSASVGILQTLCGTGVMPFCGAYAFVLGAAIGTSVITAIICSIGAKEDAKRLGIMHVIFSVFGALLCLALIEILHSCGIIGAFYRNPVGSGTVADFQTVYKLITAVLTLPLIPLLAKISHKLVKDAPMEEEDSDIVENLKGLDQHLLDNPVVATLQTEHVIGHMADVAAKNYISAIRLIDDYDEKRYDRIQQREDLLDRMADETNQYLIEISTHIERDTDNKNVNFLIKALTSFERIGDLAINIVDNILRMRKDNTVFSADARRELDIVTAAVQDVLTTTSQAFKENSEQAARMVEPLEEVVDELTEELKERHIERLKAGRCSMMNGILFQNILQHLERISDQCSDLAVYMLARTDESINGNEHRYLQVLHRSGNPEYRAAFERQHEKYDRLLREAMQDEA